MKRNLLILLLAGCLMLLAGTKTWATDNGNINLADNQQIYSAEFNGFIDTSNTYTTYNPVGDTAYQFKNENTYELQPSLDLGYHRGPHGPGHEGGHERGYGPGYGPGPELWVYTLIGIIVVSLLSGGEYR